VLFALDVGNTNLTLGVFDGEQLAAVWRLSTRASATADELGTAFRALFRESGRDPARVDGMIVCSVVPDLNAAVAEAGRAYFATDPLFVEPGIKTGMPVAYENPHEVGADRIVNAVAAAAKHGAPVIVLDFGTATTFDVVSARGEYLGGVIAPGPALSAEALFARAARLSRVDVRKPGRVIGRNTRESVQSGLFHGYVALVEGVVARIRAELGVDAPVVATGGLAAIFAAELPFLTEVNPGLTLDGLRRIWEKNAR
jgi:type III pantothenate kinase